MLTGSRWQEAQGLFLDLADLPDEERARALERLAERDPELADGVRELLAHDAGPGDDASTLLMPERFGPYEVLKPLGSGGMGEVFLARRADGEYERVVAIKLLRGGLANRQLVQRFLRERQTLAQLDHEYVASLLDGGTTDGGEPYLVMEYVEGEPADAFAAKLELRERLELFIRIGQAVAHAHERGFVHRDLKPSNILVRADGTPRLLDFGIARPEAGTPADTPGLERLTATGHRLFTPEYASPEQVRGEVATAASDTYALGVLLYVFLCGEQPWSLDLGQHALERAICEDDPVPPSRRVQGTARHRISGDLDAVVLQCLDKRAERRYASVDELCDDVQRHLDGLPIVARRTGSLGRAVRFARRKPVYPIGAVLLLVALVAGASAWRSEQRGQRSAAELLAAASDRVDTAGVLWEDGERDAARAELDAAETALAELPPTPRLQARILVQRAVFANLSREWESGLTWLEQADPLLSELDVPDRQLESTLLNSRAYALQNLAPGERSQAAQAAALDHALEHLEPGDPLRVDAYLGLALQLRRAGRREDALRVHERAILEARQRDGRSEILSRVLNEKAVVLAESGRPEEALPAYREAVEILSWHRGGGHPSLARVRLNLATAHYRVGQTEAARVEFERSLAASRELESPMFVASNQHFLGRIHLERGELEQAEAAAREALAIREELGDALHAYRSRCLLGLVHVGAGHDAEARSILEPLLDAAPPGYLLVDMEAEARHRLGVLLDDAGESVAARSQMSRALQLKQRELGPQHPDCLELERRLGGR